MTAKPLDGLDLKALAASLGDMGADAWMLFDFRGVNPVVGRVLGDAGVGMGTRRLFVFLPRTGRPVAVAHRIEEHALAGFPGDIRPYSTWRELHAEVRSLVAGKTLAMEVSPADAVPYLDRVPHGVIELLESLGARVVSSGRLVTRFAARWSARGADGTPPRRRRAGGDRGRGAAVGRGGNGPRRRGPRDDGAAPGARRHRAGRARHRPSSGRRVPAQLRAAALRAARGGGLAAGDGPDPAARSVGGAGQGERVRRPDVDGVRRARPRCRGAPGVERRPACARRRGRRVARALRQGRGQGTGISGSAGRIWTTSPGG